MTSIRYATTDDSDREASQQSAGGANARALIVAVALASIAALAVAGEPPSEQASVSAAPATVAGAAVTP